MAENTTRISPTVIVDGNITSNEDIYVEGTIKGGITTSADLFVEAKGTVEAEVSTRNIEIRGNLIGNIEASDRFELMPEGKMIGDVRAPRVVIADGAKFKGKIEMPER